MYISKKITIIDVYKKINISTFALQAELCPDLSMYLSPFILILSQYSSMPTSRFPQFLHHSISVSICHACFFFLHLTQYYVFFLHIQYISLALHVLQNCNMAAVHMVPTPFLECAYYNCQEKWSFRPNCALTFPCINLHSFLSWVNILPCLYPDFLNSSTTRSATPVYLFFIFFIPIWLSIMYSSSTFSLFHWHYMFCRIFYKCVKSILHFNLKHSKVSNVL